VWAKADVRVINAAMDRGTGHLQLNFDIRGQRADLTLGVYGLHFASNIAAAIAAALLLGENTSDILQRLTTFEPASHRGHILQLNGLRTLIDESYNSNPTALAASLHSFSQFDSARKRLFVIGEMKELGSFSQSLHFDAGKVFCDYAKESSFELFAVGEEMKSFVRAVEERLPKNGVWKWFPSGQDALESVITAYSPGAVCLVKGSRGMKLDYVVEKLKVCNAMR
jgi:UDP-N-acetylmuramoyl-tripeptide--D-alanyl-D-alanine ligase